MKRRIDTIIPNIVFALIVVAVLVGNSFISNKLYNFIPNYNEQPIFYDNAKAKNINNDSFIYEHLMFDTENIRFSNPTEEEYERILTDILGADWYIALIEMVAKMMNWPIDDNDHLHKLANQMLEYMQIGIDEFGEKRYYIFQGHKTQRGFIEGLLVAFSTERGIEQFVYMDNREINNVKYFKVKLDDFLEWRLLEIAEEYVDYIVTQGFLEPLPGLYFSTKNITSEDHICYIQDVESRITIYYDIISDRPVGFRRNRKEN